MKINQQLKDKFAHTKFAKEGGSCFECCDYEGMYDDLLEFIQILVGDQVETMIDAIDTAFEENRSECCCLACANMQHDITLDAIGSLLNNPKVE